ncbi:putative low-complexity protein-like protein [Geobacter metallireducens RCH3]|uniref:Pentapeptide repeat domain protein n=1 Tax=Geobacter metallireducens (strain ATCC 53774 / DSM 7210 / GS-15) TaxID=269799 RepID=Q39PS3_GEOMG|nr:pentapeptide repeat-containing protein [Geobacter metallireducens]ABB33751.1 pentapeptide repeat domain protein [Geobacter metallireducens GS-15]EHP85731.1 putative low-complexity protein-like protein [Geobacter metallireducens RCH3]
MKHLLFRCLGIPIVITTFFVSVGSETPAAASPAGKKKTESTEVAASSPAKPALAYAEYVRLVSRRGVAGRGHAKKKPAKAAKVTRTAKKADQKVVSAKAEPTPVVPVRTVAPVVAVEPKRGGGWRPGPAEVREVLGTTRDLSGANLRGMNLAGLDLRNASLANADLYLANLAGACLDGANLRGTSLEMANLRGASLKGAKLSGAGLFMTNLEGADLERADLTGVYAVGANLRGAALASANLRGGLFTNAVMARSVAVLTEDGEGRGGGTVTKATARDDAARPDPAERLTFLKF